MKILYSISLLSLFSCANLSKEGAKVRFLELEESPLVIQQTADKIVAKHNCSFIGYVDAETALFPGSYSLHENEVHSALRNRAAKLGANLVIANFYRKPAQGVGLSCPEEFLEQSTYE